MMFFLFGPQCAKGGECKDRNSRTHEAKTRLGEKTVFKSLVISSGMSGPFI